MTVSDFPQFEKASSFKLTGSGGVLIFYRGEVVVFVKVFGGIYVHNLVFKQLHQTNYLDIDISWYDFVKIGLLKCCQIIKHEMPLLYCFTGKGNKL